MPEAREREFNIEGHRLVALCFNEDKDTVPLIFIHGITETVGFWTVTQTPLIKEKFRWYSLSLPGHYPAVFPEGFRSQDMTDESMSRVMSACIRELVGEQQVVLAGHSTGAFAVLDIASRNPRMCKGVISVSGFVHGKWKMFHNFHWIPRLGVFTPPLFKAGLRLCIGSRFMYRMTLGFCAFDLKAFFSWEGLGPTLDLIYPAVRKLDLDSLITYFKQLSRIDITESLSNIDVPALVVFGDRDPVVPPGQSILIAKNIPRSQLVRMEAVGHFPMAEKPRDYHRVITEWIEKFL